MRVRKFVTDPVEHQGFAMNLLNKKLEGAVHVETYTKDNGRFEGARTLTIFAFYPDKEKGEEMQP